jgi:hypothetical protein
MSKRKPIPGHEDDVLICKAIVRDEIPDTRKLFDENGKQYPPQHRKGSILIEPGVYSHECVYNSGVFGNGGTYTYFFTRLDEEERPLWFSQRTYEMFIKNSPHISWDKKCKHMPKSS